MERYIKSKQAEAQEYHNHIIIKRKKNIGEKMKRKVESKGDNLIED